MARKIAILSAVAFAGLATTATIDKRITGGEDAKKGEFPYVVSIIAGSHHCGGSLLDSTTVLTAAHCIGGSTSVRAGSLSSETGGVVSEVELHIKHPRYLKEAGLYYPNDIGILKLSTPIEKSETIGYAMLPANDSDPAVNSTATVAGWGGQEPTRNLGSGRSVEKLSKLSTTVRAREYCANLDADAGGNDKLVCADGDGKSPCKYDSGGPLVDQQTGQLIGVTSWVLEDENKIFCRGPAMYTRVGSYIPFIKANLGAANRATAQEKPADGAQGQAPTPTRSGDEDEVPTSDEERRKFCAQFIGGRRFPPECLGSHADPSLSTSAADEIGTPPAGPNTASIKPCASCPSDKLCANDNGVTRCIPSKGRVPSPFNPEGAESGFNGGRLVYVT